MMSWNDGSVGLCAFSRKSVAIMMADSTLLKSWAMPPASRPRLSRRCAYASASSVRRRSVTSWTVPVTSVRSLTTRVRGLSAGLFTGVEFTTTLPEGAQTERVYLRTAFSMDPQLNVLQIMGSPNNVEVGDPADWRAAFGKHVNGEPVLDGKALTQSAPAGTVFKDRADLPLMCVVAAGRFTMGAPASESDSLVSERPQRPGRVADPAASGEDAREEKRLRPLALDEFVGQPQVRSQLAIFLEAARRRGEAMDHVLFHGPP